MKKIYAILTCLLLTAGLFSCKSDDPANEAIPAKALQSAKSELNGEIVLFSHAGLGESDNTKTEKGAPTKYTFSWKENNTLNISIKNLQIGKMPSSIQFSCDTQLQPLSSFENQEHKGEGWYAIKGENGITNAFGKEVNKGTINGFYNVNTKQIEFNINFNMMNAYAKVMEQTIDKSLLGRFDELMKEYLAGLGELKPAEGHGGKRP